MMLPDFILPSRQNKVWAYSGMDTLQDCADKKHFKSYPHNISYVYNSRGYRDKEWPLDLSNSVWCFGDSFTVGLGSPVEHTWVRILESRINQRCINISLDGASNKWIARKVLKVLNEIRPRLVVIQWSYLHRDEAPDQELHDEGRRTDYLVAEDYDQLLFLFLELITPIEMAKGNTQVIHSFIPNSVGVIDLSKEGDRFKRIWQGFAGANWDSFPQSLTEFKSINQHTIDELNCINEYANFFDYFRLLETMQVIDSVPELQRLDVARDGHHYDVITATKFVDQLVDLIALPQVG